MTGSAYAMGAPWMHIGREFARDFGPGCHADGRGPLGEWMAAMGAGRPGQREHNREHNFAGHFGMFGGPMGFGPPWAGGPKGQWRGPKARRGDVRAAILAVLSEQQMNGYQLIQEIAERSGGVWKPSPGSIYPTLQQLEDERLVQADRDSGRRTFSLTDEGRTYVESHAEEVAAPWEAMNAASDNGDTSGLKPLIGQVAAAMWQILAVGSADQQARTRDALSELRRTLYGILAEDKQDESPQDESQDNGGN